MKGLIAVAAALSALVFAQGALAQVGQVTVCPTYDGKWESSGWAGSAAPGITIVDASDEQVTVRVEEGYTLVRFCYKTGEGGGGQTSMEAPITGPATFTILKTNRGGGISHVSFDTERTSTPPDQCPNIDGVQSSVPSGMVKDANGNCVEQPPQDVCPNIAGNQSSVPSGMAKDASGNCVEQPPQDVCPNIAGNQNSVPAGLVKDSSGNCVQQQEPPTDVCPNIEGVQSSVPADLAKDASGNCTVPIVTVAVTPVPATTPLVAAAPVASSVIEKTTVQTSSKAAKVKKAKKKVKKVKKVKRAVKAKRKARLPRVLPFTP